MVLFAYFLLGEPIDKLTVLSLIASFAGIVCIADPTNLAGNELSIILILLSAVFLLCMVLPAGKRASGLAALP